MVDFELLSRLYFYFAELVFADKNRVVVIEQISDIRSQDLYELGFDLDAGSAIVVHVVLLLSPEQVVPDSSHDTLDCVGLS